nr:unnamed protein product [Callosobruchus chinensis]
MYLPKISKQSISVIIPEVCKFPLMHRLSCSGFYSLYF